ncbi:Uncharacterised protein [Achromobacter ruhlandii]|nr:Uncharacterised protein [Achromobacter ruhlandii]
MNSAMFLAGTDGFTVSTLGTFTILVMGAKSLSGLYGFLGLVAGLVAMVLTVATPRV